MRKAAHYEKWLDYDGISITVDGQRYKLEVETRSIIYPYAEEVIWVYAKYFNEELNKTLYVDVLESENVAEFEAKAEKAFQKLEKKYAR